MKKHLIATLLAIGISYSAFSQGYVTFTGGANAIKNGVTGANTVGNLSFLFAPVGTVSGLGNGMATSGLITAAKTWADVQNMLTSGWTIGSVSSVQAVGTVSGAAFGGGSFTYNGGANFHVDGWTATQESVVCVAWFGGYANIAAAAAANASLGWSTPFTVTSGASASDPAGTVNFTTAPNSMAAFGVAPVVVPEPGTMALAALGGAALLLFRRRK